MDGVMVVLRLLLLCLTAGQAASQAPTVTPGRVIEHVPCPSDPTQRLKASRGDSYEAGSARRSLELLFVQATSARREFGARRDYARAATALDLAIGIHPERAALWIELAADRAMSGQKSAAVTALQHAIEQGYTDKAALQRDERFEKLRGTPAFDTIVK